MSYPYLTGNPCTLLTSKAADETFSSVWDLGVVCDRIAMQINVIAAGALGAGVVQLLGSLDGHTFDVTPICASGSLAAKTSATPVFVYTVDKPVRYIKARIETAVTDGTVTVIGAAVTP